MDKMFLLEEERKEDIHWQLKEVKSKKEDSSSLTLSSYTLMIISVFDSLYI